MTPRAEEKQKGCGDCVHYKRQSDVPKGNPLLSNSDVVVFELKTRWHFIRGVINVIWSDTAEKQNHKYCFTWTNIYIFLQFDLTKMLTDYQTSCMNQNHFFK